MQLELLAPSIYRYNITGHLDRNVNHIRRNVFKFTTVPPVLPCYQYIQPRHLLFTLAIYLVLLYILYCSTHLTLPFLRTLCLAGGH